MHISPSFNNDHLAKLLQQTVIEKKGDEWYFFHFSNESQIKECYAEITKLFATSRFKSEFAKSSIFRTSFNDQTFFRFRVSVEQYDALFRLSNLKRICAVNNFKQLLIDIQKFIVLEDATMLADRLSKIPGIMHFTFKENLTFLTRLTYSSEKFKKELREILIKSNEESVLKELQTLWTNDCGNVSLEMLKKSYPFDRYCKTLRQRPSDELINQYEKDLQIIHKSEEKVQVTASEREYILSRKLWTDVVSVTHELNQKQIVEDQIKNKVVEKIAKLNVKNADSIYTKCLDYLRDHTVLMITFRQNSLSRNLKSYQLLNLWEIEKNRNSIHKLASNSYGNIRDKTECRYFGYLPDKQKKDFIKQKMARPRYGSLYLLDKNGTISPTANYGQSFIVFKDVVKQNSLFVPGDSLDGVGYGLSTVNNLALLLLQAPPETFQAIVMRATGDKFPHSFDQNYCGYSGGYIEVMLPPVNLLDKNCIEHIHLKKYSNGSDFITAEEIAHVKKFGISASYQSINPYIELAQEFFKVIDENNYEKLNHMLLKHPSLLKITDENDETTIERLWKAKKNFFKLYQFVIGLTGTTKIHIDNQIATSSNIALKKAFVCSVDSNELYTAFLNNSATQVRNALANHKDIKNDEWVMYAAENNQWGCVLTYLMYRVIETAATIKILQMSITHKAPDSVIQKLASLVPSNLLENYLLQIADNQGWSIVLACINAIKINMDHIIQILLRADRSQASLQTKLDFCAHLSKAKLIDYFNEAASNNYFGCLIHYLDNKKIVIENLLPMLRMAVKNNASQGIKLKIASYLNKEIYALYLFEAMEKKQYEFVLDSLKLFNLPLVKASKLIEIAELNKAPTFVKLSLSRYLSKPSLEAYTIKAAKQDDWDFVISTLKNNDVKLDITMLLNMAVKNSASSQVRKELCAYASQDQLMSYIKNRIASSHLDEEEEKNHLSRVILNSICESNNPHSLVDFLNNIFELEKKHPFISKASAVSWKGWRWKGISVSSVWIKLMDTAKEKIVTLASCLSNSIESNDKDIVIFLETPTTRWSDFFGSNTGTALKEYLVLREKYLKNTHEQTAKSSV